MKRYNCFWIFVLMLVTNTTWAYGGGGSSSTKACAKPKFTEFVPAENAEVAAGSNFSFTASANTYPSSIKVTIKGLPATIKVTPKTVGTFEVNGSLPTSLKGTYARIAIEADAQSKCNGGGGWLVKIAE
jgi:hypothetical protein